ncbi:hypothetical protein JB92DRAFT_2836136 [Gautieria morchelliformis]|nr:hypothetical protein JB92DRAFT_2836136 [Gautieria morchelliformis]
MATRLRPPVLVHCQSFLGCLMGRLSAKPFTDSTPTFTRTNEQDIHYIPDNRHTSAFTMSVAETPWNAHGNEDMHLEILTHRSRGRQRSRRDSTYTRPAQLARSSLSSQIQRFTSVYRPLHNSLVWLGSFGASASSADASLVAWRACALELNHA